MTADLRERLERAAQELAITAPLGSERFMDAVDTAVEFIREAAARLGEREWHDISEAPKDEKDILVAFRGQRQWVMFVARAFGAQTKSPEYAPPTHFMLLPSPPESTNDR